jgi:ribosome-binding ATPase YchF (GTP1/OBG family)
MQITILGAPGSGKTTLFESLLDIHGEATGKAAIANIAIPDPRIDYLSGVFQPKKTTYAKITFYDTPAEVNRLSKSSFTPEFYNFIRKSDLIIVVMSVLESDGDGLVKEALQKIAAHESELILSDYSVVEKRLQNLAKAPAEKEESDTLARFKLHLEDDLPLRAAAVSADEKKRTVHYNFLSEKPVIYLVNYAEGHAEGASFLATEAGFVSLAQKNHFGFYHAALSLEKEISTLSPTDRTNFLKEYSLTETVKTALLQEAFKSLNLISFLTVGKDEVRAWELTRDSTALIAAGKIHSDIARGFIKAEVIHVDEFREFGDLGKAKKEGKVRLEGKEYIVQDGDIIDFKFNV